MKIKRFIFLLEWKQWKNCWIVDCCCLHKKQSFLIAALWVMGLSPSYSTQSILSLAFIRVAKPIKKDNLFFSSKTNQPKGTEMEVHEWTGMECYRGRGLVPSHNQQQIKKEEINSIKSNAGEPRAAFDWWIWFHLLKKRRREKKTPAAPTNSTALLPLFHWSLLWLAALAAWCSIRFLSLHWRSLLHYWIPFNHSAILSHSVQSAHSLWNVFVAHESNEIELFSSLGGAIGRCPPHNPPIKEIQFHFHQSQLRPSIKDK